MVDMVVDPHLGEHVLLPLDDVLHVPHLGSKVLLLAAQLILDPPPSRTCRGPGREALAAPDADRALPQPLG